MGSLGKTLICFVLFKIKKGAMLSCLFKLHYV